MYDLSATANLAASVKKKKKERKCREKGVRFKSFEASLVRSTAPPSAPPIKNTHRGLMRLALISRQQWQPSLKHTKKEQSPPTRLPLFPKKLAALSNENVTKQWRPFVIDSLVTAHRLASY